MAKFKNDFMMVGKLVDKNLVEKVSNRTGKEYISGTLDIEVKKEQDGKLVPNLFTVNLLAMKYRKDGKENGLYKGYKTIIDDYKIGDPVRVKGSLGMEEYYNANRERISSYQKYNALSVSRLTEEELSNQEVKPVALATIDTTIISTDIDEDGVMKVDCFTTDFRGDYIKLFNVTVAENVMDTFPNFYFEGQTGEITYDLYSYAEEVEKESPEIEVATGFGSQVRVESDVKVFSRKIVKQEIIGGAVPYDNNEKVLTEEQIKDILEKHEQKLEELRADNNLTPNEQAFGQPETQTVSENDIPEINPFSSNTSNPFA